MSSLADKAILPGADNRPPILEKDMYDSWSTRMELYMLNIQHGRMILESVEHGPLLWPTVEEDGVTRLKKYSKLFAAEAIQADCDVKATNIILQALSEDLCIGRDKAASTSHSSPLHLPSASCRGDRPEVTLPHRKRLDIALGPRYEGAPVSTDTELGGYVREFETRVRQDTDEIYMRLDDEQTERQLLAGRLNMLFRDRRAHAYARQLMETEARMSREAWVRATDASDLVHGEVMSLRTTMLGQMLEIRELQAADRRRQTVISELLRIDHRRSTEISELRTALQGHVTALQA
nr:hypothetical protein [Tanacetum cinerariifolium]